MSMSPTLERSPLASERLVSLDAYRGFIMMALSFNGFGLAATAKRHLDQNPDSQVWTFLQFQFSHVEWAGCSFWDLIQPSFMFMVGVSMAYSYVKRADRGDSWGSMLLHAATRAIILVFLGVFLTSNGSKSTEWSLMNVLTQIGLGYVFLFMVWRKHFLVQTAIAFGILAVVWFAYESYSGEAINPETGAQHAGVDSAWAQKHLDGVPAPWQKNVNVGSYLDRYVMNWLPRDKPFEFNRGGYQTLNFVPSIATMIFGLLMGELLRSDRSSRSKLAVMSACAIAGILLGLACVQIGCPLIKRIWTPSWTLYSTGICIAILAGFYLVIDVLGWKAWSILLTVLGMNSIAVYTMGMLLRPWTERTLQTHLGAEIFQIFGAAYEPTMRAVAVGGCFWLACYWMYRNKIFVRI